MNTLTSDTALNILVWGLILVFIITIILEAIRDRRN